MDVYVHVHVCICTCYVDMEATSLCCVSSLFTSFFKIYLFYYFMYASVLPGPQRDRKEVLDPWL